MRDSLIVVFSIAVLIGVCALPLAQPATTVQALTIGIVSSAHQTVSTGCYAAQIVLNFTSPTFDTISFSSFYLYFTGSNQPVLTNLNYVQPNSTRSFAVFPQVPVTFQLKFTKLCIPTSLTELQVFLFFNGATTIQTRLF